ncbi:hypothetical protein ACFU8Q_19550 [Streptomyces sp. NPDC057543]|uniref:hypothetical protein n=1 Tax=Streptomyces sp. NPDC057543 TaxID=3346163 RepID=UPI0036B6A613
MAGTSGILSPVSAQPVYGRVWTSANLDLLAPPVGSWVAVPGCEITLPQAGTYEVTAEAEGSINQGGQSGQGTVICTRLFNTTAGAVVRTGRGSR